MRYDDDDDDSNSYEVFVTLNVCSRSYMITRSQNRKKGKCLIGSI